MRVQRFLSWRRVAGLAAVVTALLAVMAGVALASQHSAAPPVHHVASPLNLVAGDQDDRLSAPHALAHGYMPAGNCVVQGDVFDAVSGVPVKGAYIGISIGQLGSGATYVNSDAKGHYSIKGLGCTTYNMIANRYLINKTDPMYLSQTQMGVNAQSSVTNVYFRLQPEMAPGMRRANGGHVQNVLLLDYDETYYESWFTDHKSMADHTPATHAIAAAGMNGANMWTKYGYSPIDHYEFATGAYPTWRSPDAPSKLWGQVNGLDTGIWYGDYGPEENFGQQSIFDIAKGYGMSTAVIGGKDYPTGHITDMNVDLIDLSYGPNGVPTQWVASVENFITTTAGSNPNGFLIYMPITQAESRAVEGTSPDVKGSFYQMATKWDDQAVALLMKWMKDNGYLANTDVVISADEAENDLTQFDNFYGVGSTGMGTTRHEPFVMMGPNIVTGGQVDYNLHYSYDIPNTIMYALGLPAPIESRGAALTNFFVNSARPTPTPAPTQVPTNLIVDGSFEVPSASWITTGTITPQRSQDRASDGVWSMLLGSKTPGVGGESMIQQTINIPATANRATLEFDYWGYSNVWWAWAYQEAGIVVNGTQIRFMWDDSNDQSWIHRTYDLSAYRGQTVTVYFNVHGLGYKKYLTYMYVDNVKVNVQ